MSGWKQKISDKKFFFPKVARNHFLVLLNNSWEKNNFSTEFNFLSLWSPLGKFLDFFWFKKIIFSKKISTGKKTGFQQFWRVECRAFNSNDPRKMLQNRFFVILRDFLLPWSNNQNFPASPGHKISFPGNANRLRVGCSMKAAEFSVEMQSEPHANVYVWVSLAGFATLKGFSLPGSHSDERFERFSSLLLLTHVDWIQFFGKFKPFDG